MNLELVLAECIAAKKPANTFVLNETTLLEEVPVVVGEGGTDQKVVLENATAASIRSYFGVKTADTTPEGNKKSESK